MPLIRSRTLPSALIRNISFDSFWHLCCTRCRHADTQTLQNRSAQCAFSHSSLLLGVFLSSLKEPAFENPLSFPPLSIINWWEIVAFVSFMLKPKYEHKQLLGCILTTYIMKRKDANKGFFIWFEREEVKSWRQHALMRMLASPRQGKPTMKICQNYEKEVLVK